MNRTQLTQSLQTFCSTKLSLWHKYRKFALYRHTEDFVQWLSFDTSQFEVVAVPSYSIQALAIQFPAIALTLGDRIRDQRGVDLWIKPDDWATERDMLCELIIQQIDPSALKPLAIGTICDFLDRVQSDHPTAVTERGIAAIVAGDIGRGYHCFELALEKYKKDPRAWARVEEARLNGWLLCSPEDILPVLRQQAKIGAQLLRLK